MNEYIGIDCLKNGESGRVVCINCAQALRKRLLDIGISQNTVLRCVGTSPMGDPKAYSFHGTVMAIRKSDGKDICVEKLCGGVPQ